MHKFKNRMLSLLLVVAMILPMMMVTAGAISYGSSIVIDSDTGVVSGSITVTGSTLKHKVTVAVIADFPYLTSSQLGEAKSDFERVANGLNPAALDIAATKFPCVVYTFEPSGDSGTMTYELSSMTALKIDAILESAITTLITEQGITATEGPGGGYPYKVVIHTEDNTQHIVKSFELGATPQASSLVAAPKTLKGTYTYDLDLDSASGDATNAETLKTTLSITGDTEVLINKFELVGDIAGLGSVAGFDTITAAAPKKIAGDTELVFTVNDWGAVLGSTSATGSIRLTYQKDANEAAGEIGVLEIPVSLGDGSLPMLQAEAGVMGYVENTTPPEYTIVITNLGAATTTITAATTQKGDITDYTITGDDINTAITAGGTCELKITPPVRGQGSYSTLITISYNNGLDEMGAFLNIPVTLTVTPATVETAELSAAPSSKTWTVTQAGTPTGDFDFQIKNVGTADAKIEKIELKDFGSASAVTGIEAGTTVVNKNDGTAVAKVTPPTDLSTTDVGTTSGSLVITYSDAGGSTGTLTIPLKLEVTAAAKVDTKITQVKTTAVYTGADLSDTAGIKVVTADASETTVEHTGSWNTTPKDVGFYTYTVTGVTGNYNIPATATAAFKITAAKLDTPTLGSPKNPSVAGAADGTVTISNYVTGGSYEVYKDGTIMDTQPTIENGVIQGLAAGTYTVVHKAGDSNHSDSDHSAGVTLSDPAAQDTVLSITPATGVYSGNAHAPTVVVTAGDTALTLNTDYTVAWKPTDVANTTLLNVDTYTCVIRFTPSGKYNDPTGDSTYSITPLKRAAVTLKDIKHVTTAGGTEGSFTIESYSSANTYEYSTDGTSYGALPTDAAIDASGVVTKLTAGTYYVRLAAVDNNHTAGDVGTATIDAPTKGFVEVTLKKDANTPYTGQTVTLDSTSGTAVTEDGTTGVYKAADIAPGSIKVFVGTKEVGTVTVVAGKTAKETYDFYTLTLTVGTGGTIGNATATGVYLSGTTLSDAVTADTGYAFDKWTVSNGGVTTEFPDTLLATTTLHANFKFAAIVLPPNAGTDAGSPGAVPGGALTYGTAATPSVGGATGGNGATFTYALANGSTLPAGLTMANDGAISGKPAVAVTDHAFAVVITPSVGDPVTAYWKMTVNKATPTLSLAAKGETHYQGDTSSDHITPTLSGGVYYNGNPTSSYNASNWVALTAADLTTASALVYNPTTLPANGKVTVSVDGTETSGSGTATLGDVWNTVTKDITLTLSTTQTVTVRVLKDGAVYNQHNGKVATIAGTITRTGTIGADGTIAITGVPTGTYAVSIAEGPTLTDFVVGNANVHADFNYYTLTVADGVGSESAAITNPTGGVYLDGTVVAVTATAKTGYSGAVTWTLNPATPSSVSGNDITVKGTVTATASFAVTPITFTGTGLAGVSYGAASYSASVAATGGSGAFTYASADIPDWLSIATDGTIALNAANVTGDAKTEAYSFTVTATDNAVSTNTAIATFTIVVTKADRPKAAITTPVAPTRLGGTDGTLTITGYDSTLTYQISSNDGGGWEDIATTSISSGVVGGLSAGTYVVRIKGDTNHEDGAKSDAVVIPDGKLYTGAVEIKLDGNFLTALTGEVTAVTIGGANATYNTTSNKWEVTTLSSDNDTAGNAVVVTASEKTITYSVVIKSNSQTATPVAFYTVVVDTNATTTGVNGYTTTIVDSALSGGVSNGDVVLAGTEVTFKLTETFTENQDYNVAWANTDAPDSGKVTYNESKAGKSVGATVTYNLYTVTGVGGRGTGGFTLTGTTLDGKVIGTGDAIEGTGTGAGTGGASNGAIAFTDKVPSGTYTIGYTLDTKYSVDTVNSDTGIGKGGIKVTKGDALGAFKLATDTATYGVTLSARSDNTADGTDGVLEVDGDASTINRDYTYTGDTTITVTISNAGNSTIKDLTATGTSDTNFKVTGLTATDVAAGDSATFTITAKGDLNAGDYPAAITISGKTVDGNPADFNGPAAGTNLVYTLNLAVEPMALKTATVRNDAGGAIKDGTELTVTGLTDNKDAAVAINTTNATYQWQRNSGTGGAWENISEATSISYTVDEANDAGHSLRAVVTGKGNYKEIVYSTETNPVAYTGEVKVYVDTKTAAAAKLGKDYTLSLTENGGSGTINLTDGNGDGIYTTAVGELDATKSYDLTVQVVKGKSETKTIANAISRTDKSAEVFYFTVNYDNATAVDKFDDNSNQTGVTVSAKTSDSSTAVDAGTTVLSGTSITFTAATWTTDYALTWNNDIDTETNGTDGIKEYSDVVPAVTGTLTENTYEISGTIDTTKGGTAAHVEKVTFTDAAHAGRVVSGTISGTTVKVTVPVGTYNIAAAILSAQQGETVIDGYKVGTDAGASITVATSSNKGFTVVLDGAKYTFTVTDGNGNNNAETWADLTYGDARPDAVTVTITNTGNRDLTNVTVTPGGDKDQFTAGTVTNVTIPHTTNNTVTFTVQPNDNLAYGDYTATYVVSTARDAVSDADSTFTAKQKVNKATLSDNLGVDEVTDPTSQNVGANLDSAAVGAGTNASFIKTVSAVTWKAGAETVTTVAPGKQYTASVTITLDDNHKFAETLDAGDFTFNESVPTTVTRVNESNVTLEYTFNYTKPTLSGGTAAGTAYDKGEFSITGNGDGLKYVYVLSTNGALNPNGAAVAAGGIDGQIGAVGKSDTASFTDLPTPDSDYHVYAAAYVDGTNPLVYSAVTKLTFKTWYKVAVKFTGHDGNGDNAPKLGVTAMDNTTPLAISVEQSKDSAANALNVVSDYGYWEFDKWTASPNVGTVPTTLTGGKYTAPASDQGTSGVITLTVAFKGADLEINPDAIAYDGTGEYGKVYNGPAPTVTGGSGSYTFEVVAPTTRAVTSGALPAGLKMNADTGAITGKPEAVGAYTFAVKVTDKKTGKSFTSNAVDVTISAATPILSDIAYTEGTYYVDNALDNSALSGKAMVPVLTTAAADAVDGVAVWTDTDIGGGTTKAGNWTFKTDTDYKGNGAGKDGPSDYAVTFTPTDTVHYKAADGKVAITSLIKTFGLEFVAQQFGASAVYGDNTKTLTFKVKNTGNQPTGALTYTITGTDKDSFVPVNPPTAALPSEDDVTGAIVVNIGDDLAVAGGKTYTATLTVTGDNAEGTGKLSIKAELTYTVKPAPIKGTTVTDLTPPAKDGLPDTAVSPAASANYDVTSVTWTPSVAQGGTFAAGTVYTAEIVLRANDNYEFAAGTYGIDTLTGVTKLITGEGEKNTVTLTKTFPATGAGTITVTAEANDHESGTITSISSPSTVPVEYYYIVSDTDKTVDEIKASKDHVTGDVVEGNAVAANIPLAGLSAGTTYKVYVLEKIGTEWGTTMAVSAPFTTDYRITIGTLDNGTVSPSTTFYVAAGESAEMTAAAASGYEFKSWTLDPVDGGSFDHVNKATATLTPSKNVEVTATFGGLPALQVTGQPYGNQVSQGYDASTINVYLNGKVENIGIGNMVGELAAHVVAKGADFAAAEDETFTVKFGSNTALAAGGSTTMAVSPKTGLTSTGGIAGVYTATIWVYEIGREADAKSVDVTIVIIPAGDPAFKPIDKNWDLKSGATNDPWVITVKENGSTIGKPTQNGVELTGTTDYTYVRDDATGTGVLTLTQAYLNTLAAEANRKAGDTVEIVVPATNGGTTKNTTLVLTYIDTTPTVESVQIKPNAGFASGETLTAIAKVSSGAAITAGQVTYTWYHTSIADGNKLSGPNNDSTYTLASADAGKIILVKAMGDGTNYRDSATSLETDPSGYQITVAVPQVDGKVPGTAVPTSQKVAKGGAVQLVATANPGFKFKNWDESGVGGSYTAGSANSATATVKPTADGTISANFEKGIITYNSGALAAVKFNANSYTASVATATSTATGNFTYTIVSGLPTWLELASDGTLSVKSGERVATNVIPNNTTELSFTVTATQEGSGATQTATFTIDVTPGDLFATPTYTSGKTNYVGDSLDGTKLVGDTTNAAGTVIAGAWAPTTPGAKITADGTNDYSFTFTPTNEQDKTNYEALVEDISITAAASTVSINARDTAIPANGFKVVSKEYRVAGTPISVTVKNTGEQNVTLAAVTTDSDKFDVSAYAGGVTAPTLTPTSTPATNTTTFTITPKADTPVGEYKDVVFTVNTAQIGGNDGPTATFKVTLNVTRKEMTGPIAITELDEPKTNLGLDTAVDTNAADDATYGKNYTVESLVWAPADGTAGEGKDYTVTITLKPNGNYKFPAITDDNYTLNDKKVSENGMKVEPGADGKIIITKTFPKTNLVNVTANVTKPVEDATPVVPTTPGDNYTVTGTWKDKATDTPMGPSDKFVKDKEYTVTITVTPKPGFTFPSESNKAEIIAKLNESGTTVSADDKITVNGDGTITIVKDYTASAKPSDPIIPPPSGGDGGGGSTAFTVTYDLRDLGTTKDKTTESVVSGKKPTGVPAVTGNAGLTFKHWSLENPAEVKEPKKVDPKTVVIKADTIFYAVYDGHIIGEHEHFIKGLPDGNFGPAQDITRAEVATIIARACLGGFIEGAPSTSIYPDVPGHWAQSAIDFCTSKGVFVGYDDGMFHPDTPITRQEFATVFARLAGLKKTGDMPFSDIGIAHEWALDGIYTAYVNGWVIGYTDGTFKPLNNIARSEAVKIVDAYLGRGVNEAGVKDVLKDVKQWPDVSESYWAYYEIMEASNDHTYHYADEKARPEVWTKAYIEKASWGE